VSAAPTVAAVLLAGGQARRMGGGDKCLKRLAGRTLLDLVIGRARPQAAALVLNANGDPARFAGFGLPVVADPVEGFAGPLAGILAGLDWAAANAPGAVHVASIATDTPFFPPDLVDRLKDAVARSPAPIGCAASRGRLHPVFGLWPVALAEDLRAALAGGTRKVDEWTARHGIAVAHFDDPAGDPFFNINTADDLAEAERRVGEHVQ
jgi:molybdopterin-guanine dinucleotide biosynthesis protein A